MNGHGGKRPGAGRPKGAASRANEEVRQEAAATGELPPAVEPPRQAARHPQDRARGVSSGSSARTATSRYDRDSERQENALVTKMVANTRPWAGIERHVTTRAAVIPNTNQHLSGQNKTGRDGRQQISSAVLSTTQPPLGGCKEIYLVWPPSCVTVRGPQTLG